MKKGELHQPKTFSKSAKQIQLFQWQLLLIISIVLGLGYLLGQRNQSPQPTLAQPVVKKTQGNILPVETIKIEAVQSYQTSQTFTGEVQASRSSEVGFERGGKLIEVLVDEGDRITEGMPLAKLDTANLEAEKKSLLAQKAQAQAVLAELENGTRSEQIAAAQASVRDLEQQLELEKLKSSRREYLFREGAIAREQLEEISFNSKALNERLANAKSNLSELRNGTRVEQIKAQQAAVDGLTAQIENLDISITKSSLKAPFEGIVAARNLDEGTVVETGQSILRLVEDIQPEVKVGLPLAMVSKMELGSEQQVKIAGTNFSAIVNAILPEVDPATRTRSVILKLAPSASNQVAPGQITRLAVSQTSSTDGYWLPINALVKADKGLWSCLAVVKTDNNQTKIERRYVELLETQEDRVLVRGTLQPGDSIVVNGTHRFVPGQLVRLINN
ncbi:efflux RND transporter periplasmic adaptor subunit [Pleurocapsa sp. PCC 7319]|uniref:efflux RND transporter periplasmic adaptor subunit n=1 Tax=Pleurocapsa sp. PCC 7319 TaxID=118161 RepID=UPI00034864A6|nr:efflux RND transporter periplasmic adaptor subunit [Pleurocapsa sp. PCC 7319]